MADLRLVAACAPGLRAALHCTYQYLLPSLTVGSLRGRSNGGDPVCGQGHHYMYEATSPPARGVGNMHGRG